MWIKQLIQTFIYKKIPLDTKKRKNKKKDKATNTFGTIRRIWSYLLNEKAKLFLVIFMVLMSSGLSLLGPFMIGMAVDDFIVTKQTSGLGVLLIWLILIFLFHSLSIFLQNYWMIGIAQQTVFTLRTDLFKQFHHLPISYFDKNQHAELMSRVTNDIDNINNTLNQSVIQIFASILTLIGTVSMMLLLSPILTLVAMTIIPTMFLAMRWITNRTKILYKLQQRDLGYVNGYVEEIVSGQHIVKTFSQEERVSKEFQSKSKQLQHSNFWAMTISGYIPKVMNMKSEEQ